MAEKPTGNGNRRHFAVRLATWILVVTVAASIYSFATRPDEPLDRLKGIQVVDDHKIVDKGRCLRMLKVKASEDACRNAISKTLSAHMPWTTISYKPRPMGRYCSFISADERYEINITAGGSGVFTQIEEQRPASTGERVAGWLADLASDFGAKKA